jgi:hypothetical protein
MKKLLLLASAILCFFSSFSQLTCVEKEDEISHYFDSLIQADSDSLKLASCQQIQNSFETLLQKEESFSYPFAKLNRMGKISSPDAAFRIYNWNCVLSDGSYRYFGLIQYPTKQGIHVEVLHDSAQHADMMRSNTATDWPGALYYQIVPFKTKKETAYLLLGWDGNNVSTTKKVIEILSFADNGRSNFGMPVILWRGKMLHRVVFEYAKQAQMSLQYQEKKKQIVFDHLAPSSPNYQNQFEYYGPDFSYDALEYRKGIWELLENIDVRN